MVPWGEILECNDLDIWVLVLDLKKRFFEKYISQRKWSYLREVPENKVPCSWMMILSAIFWGFIKVHSHDLHTVLIEGRSSHFLTVEIAYVKLTLNTRPQLSRYCAVRLIGAIPFMKGIPAKKNLSPLKLFHWIIMAVRCTTDIPCQECKTRDEKTSIELWSKSGEQENQDKGCHAIKPCWIPKEKQERSDQKGCSR